MKLSLDSIPDFIHKAPKGTHYQVEQFKSGVVSVWVHYDRQFDYNLGKRVRCIWGFYRPKTNQFFAPVNSSTVGKEVNIEDTRPWSAMPINYMGIERFFA
jgi:hypothetical protein